VSPDIGAPTQWNIPPSEAIPRKHTHSLASLGLRERLMEFHDRVLKCAECSAEFIFTAGEQMFFADKGFKNEPKRCKGCKARRAEGAGPGVMGGLQVRSETKTNCSQCGKDTTVPFRPTQGRPVFCRECFQQRRSMGAA
jgi:CxxC-x17-CxxC domain-containing protein